jgi:hypothetical protein
MPRGFPRFRDPWQVWALAAPLAACGTGGRGENTFRSRGAPSRPSHIDDQASKQTAAGRDLRQMAPVVGPAAVTITRGKFVAWVERSETQERRAKRRCRSLGFAFAQPRLRKEKRKAERRKALCNNLRALTGTARALRRARLSAFHHGTCGSDRTPPLSLSHATSWDVFGAHAPMVRKTCASQHMTRKPANRPSMRHSRALPAPYCPSPARLHPQTGHDAGRACLAQAAREPR